MIYREDPLNGQEREKHSVKGIEFYILGFGSVRSDDSDSITLKSDSAGDQLCFRMSMHIPPRSEIFM